MLEFFTLSTIFESQCLIVAIICAWGAFNGQWRYIIPYLLLTCVVECIGIYLKHRHQANQWPYNILLVGHIAFISYMFSQLLQKNSRSKPVIITGLVLLALAYGYDLLQHGFLRFNVLTYNVMSVVFAIYALYYFYVLLHDDTNTQLGFSFEFWWVCGILFFFFGATAVNLFRGKLSTIMITPKHALPYYIYMVLNIILYTCWSYSFICKRWLTKRSGI
jgi:hypothetical protein